MPGPFCECQAMLKTDLSGTLADPAECAWSRSALAHAAACDPGLLSTSGPSGPSGWGCSCCAAAALKGREGWLPPPGAACEGPAVPDAWRAAIRRAAPAASSAAAASSAGLSDAEGPAASNRARRLRFRPLACMLSSDSRIDQTICCHSCSMPCVKPGLITGQDCWVQSAQHHTCGTPLAAISTQALTFCRQQMPALP